MGCDAFAYQTTNKPENVTKVKVDRQELALCSVSQISLPKLGRLLSQIKIPVWSRRDTGVDLKNKRHVCGSGFSPLGAAGQTASVCVTRLHHNRCTSDDSHCWRGDEFECGVDGVCERACVKERKEIKHRGWARGNWERAAQKELRDQTEDMAGDEKTDHVSVDGGDRRVSLLLELLQFWLTVMAL